MNFRLIGNRDEIMAAALFDRYATADPRRIRSRRIASRVNTS
jgi:hypothetical protein